MPGRQGIDLRETLFDILAAGGGLSLRVVG